jgi:hypothetical protein
MAFNLKAILSVAAPLLTSALPGPFGNLASSLIGKALNLKDGATVEDISKAIDSGQLTGDQMVALKEQELLFQEQMKKLDLDSVERMEALAAADRASARQRETVVRDWTPRILAYAVTVGFFGVLGYIVQVDVRPAAHDTLLVLLGSLSTAWTAIITYYFGSSAGSDKKTELLASHEGKA